MSDKPFILVVEDNEGERELLARILKLRGFEVVDAESGFEAVEEAKNRFFNAAIIDIILPDINGIEVLKELKKINDETMGIMITGYASIESTVEAMNEGAYSYIIKPFNINEVVITTRRALEKQELSLQNKRLLKELSALNLRLLKSNKEMEDFLAIVSHDIKGYLDVITGYANLLDRSSNENLTDQERDQVKGITRVSGILHLTIRNLLQNAAIQAGKTDLRVEKFPISEVLYNVIELINPLTDEKALRIDIQGRVDQEILADREKTHAIIINILSNAVKVSPPGETVKIEIAEDKKDKLKISISDHGPGIPDGIRQKIFSKFERAEEQGKGIGMGLYIAKKFIELHQEEIEIESEPDKGTRISFTLAIPPKPQEPIKIKF